ncbi:MAG: NACHT domain-containing protein [Alphaproteobacteria bacterium]|nr:MAG: NACHT domain-containing protein [Alphaproteobacteria bacterium]
MPLWGGDMVEPTALVALATDIAVKEALKTGTASLTKAASQLGKRTTDNLVVALQLGFHDYMRVSYEKCRYFKSILPPSQPRDILSHYIPADIKVGDSTIEDVSLFEEPTRGKKFVLTGLAGSGKSMLLKHFVATYFDKPRGPTPLFVELRRLNKLTNRNLLSFIRTYCVSASNQITERQFGIALKSGVFSLILDGFDEVNDDYKMEVQDQILDIQRLYPDVMIVVSSRPDPRFRGWVNFSVYSVAELSKEKCIELIDSFEYDVGTKRRFKDRVNKDLWASHKSFLQYPLLVSIMLLTYEEFADIPNRRHVFYRRAFDTLLVKHDADKEQYQRALKTKLQVEEFRAVFAAFCGLSYIKGKISFDEESLRSFCENASKYCQNTKELDSPVKSDHFISDLFNAVCMLQHDGLDTTFVHRSFQEYFAAYFASRLPNDKMDKVLDSFAERFNDQALAMAFDMSREVLEISWCLTKIDTLLDCLSDERLLPIERMSKLAESFTIDIREDDIIVSSLRHSDLLAISNAMAQLYAIRTSVDNIFVLLNGLSRKKLLQSIRSKDNASRHNYNLFVGNNINDWKTVTLTMAPENQWWFSILGGDEVIENMRQDLEKTKRAIRGRDRKADAIIDSLL